MGGADMSAVDWEEAAILFSASHLVVTQPYLLAIGAGQSSASALLEAVLFAFVE
jgi:hypothetical protein